MDPPENTGFPADQAPLVDKILTLCREHLTEGPIAATTYVIEPQTSTVVPVEMYMPNEVAKDVASALVRWTVKNLHASTTIMVSEAWSLSPEDTPHYDRIVKQYGSIGEYPGKIDILMVSVQTRAGTWLGRAPIEKKGDARRIGKMEVVKADHDGNLSNFLGDGT